MSAKLSVRLLGPPRLDAGDPPASLDPPGIKGSALLYYLASRPEQPVARPTALAMLWEDSDESEGRNNLSTALSRLRRGLPVMPIQTVGDTLVWRPPVALGQGVEVDLESFQRLAGPSATAADLDAALALYRGPFLEGFALKESGAFDEWLDLERAGWQRTVLDVQERAAQAHAAQRNWTSALHHLRRALSIDPLQERFHRHLLRVAYLSGDRPAALTHYRGLVALLDAELGVEPDRETRRLHQAILHNEPLDEWRTEPAPPPTRAPSVPAPPPLPRVPPRRGPRSMPSRPALALVGRDGELRTLLAQAHTVAAGGSARTLVEGEAGIGKTRLLDELAWRLASAGRPGEGGPWLILRGACHEAERGLAYHPLVDVLSAAASAVDPAHLPVSDIWLAEVARLVPDLNEGRPALPIPERLDPKQEQRRLFEGIARFLAALPRPILAIVEDVHWADESTLQILAYLARHDTLPGVHLVYSLRSDDADDHVAAWATRLEGGRHTERIALQRLGEADTTALLSEIVHGEVESLGRLLHVETEGNPLFAVETIRALQEIGDLQVVPRGGSSPGTPEQQGLRVPDSVQAVIRSRLARLAGDARDFANAAAVLGGAVEFEQARDVASQDEARALVALERLLAAHVMREVTDHLGESVSVFSHDKIRRVVYDDLSGARRRVLHRRAMERLSASPSVPPERLAYHAVRCQAWEAGLTWSEDAARAALSVFAYGSAASLYEQALNCLQRLPASPERRKQGIVLRLRLAQVGYYAHPGRVSEWLRPAEAEAQVLGDPTLLLRVWLAQASALYIQGQFAEVLAMLERMRPVAEAADPTLRARYASIRGQMLTLRGEYAAAIEPLQDALRYLADRPSIQRTVVTQMLAAAHAYRGDFATAARFLDEAHASTQRATDQAAVAANLVFQEAVHQMRGDWALSFEFGQRTIEAARAAGDTLHEYIGHVFLGLPQARLGDPDGAALRLEHAIGMAREAGLLVFLGRAYARLGEVELIRSRPELALEAATTGQAIAAAQGFLFDAALCDRVSGEALTALGQFERAEERLRSALDQFAGIGSRPEIGRSHASLARLAEARGDHPATIREAAAAEALFDALGMDDERSIISALARQPATLAT